jgi:hypothetical protein
VVNYIKNRLRERSTWIGLSAFFSALGYKYTDATLDAVTEIAVIICGLVLAFFPDAASHEQSNPPS